MTERRLTITGEGIVLGTTVLAKFVDGGLCMDEAKVLSLLSVVYGQCVSPSVARNFHAAAKSYKEGDETIALMHLALTGLPALHKMDQVQLLSEADDFLNSGRTPLALLKFCGIETILDCPVAQELYKFVTKYNPYHKPAGTSDGGQFTTVDGMGSAPAKPQSWYERNKGWVKPVAIGAAVAAGVATAILTDGIAVSEEIEGAEALMGGEVTSEKLTSEQVQNFARFKSKLPANANPRTIKDLPDGGKIFQADVPARNIPGSYARYEKVVDSSGNTISYKKTTYAPDGSVVHIKNK